MRHRSKKEHMSRKSVQVQRKGRPGLLPPLGVDFKTALGALLKTPPPPAGNKATRKAAQKLIRPTQKKRW